jgi:hypothetical protein
VAASSSHTSETLSAPEIQGQTYQQRSNRQKLYQCLKNKVLYIVICWNLSTKVKQTETLSAPEIQGQTYQQRSKREKLCQCLKYKVYIDICSNLSTKVKQRETRGPKATLLTW